jgi:hypothetical protein
MQREVELPKMYAALFQTRLVAVLWQEISRVEIYGRPKCLGLRSVAGGGRRLFEGFYIHPQRRVRGHRKLLVSKEQVARSTSGGAHPIHELSSCRSKLHIRRG